MLLFTSSRNLVSLAAAIALSAAAQAEVVDGRPPPTARKSLPVTDLQSAIDQTAAIVEGQVTDVQYEFTRRDGPWTRVTLSDVRAHFGSAPEKLELRHFGGPLNDVSILLVAELPEFIKGERYLVFLRNTAWNLSPVVDNLAFRVEVVGEAEALVNSDGFAVVGIGADGVELGPEILGNVSLNEALHGSPEVDAAESVTEARRPTALGAGSGESARETSSAQERQPLAVESFLAALDTIFETGGMNPSGNFYNRPAGEFKWFRQRTEGPAGENPMREEGAISTVPEVDTSGPIE
jgi:hypothetical protein